MGEVLTAFPTLLAVLQILPVLLCFSRVKEDGETDFIIGSSVASLISQRRVCRMKKKHKSSVHVIPESDGTQRLHWSRLEARGSRSAACAFSRIFSDWKSATCTAPQPIPTPPFIINHRPSTYATTIPTFITLQHIARTLVKYNCTLSKCHHSLHRLWSQVVAYCCYPLFGW